MTRMKGLEKEKEALEKDRDALLGEIRTIKSNMTPKQFRKYCGNNFREWDAEDILIGILLRLRMSQLAYELRKRAFSSSVADHAEGKDQTLEMNAGILTEVIAALAISSQEEEADHLHCGLLHDEMAIKSAKEYDASGKCITGTKSLVLSKCYIW